MKINEFLNLYVGYNNEEDFCILICAQNEQEALEIANSKKTYACIDGEFEITRFTDIDTEFDCEYVLQQ